jgi:hypothetical protein
MAERCHDLLPSRCYYPTLAQKEDEKDLHLKPPQEERKDAGELFTEMP